MAKGRDRHQARLAAVNALGRPLNRRARSRCELCEDSASLKVVEVEGNPEDEPSEDWAALLCARCTDLPGSKRLRSDELRFLETAMWSEVRPVQILAVRLVRRLAGDDVTWARDALDSLYLDPEVEAAL